MSLWIRRTLLTIKRKLRHVFSSKTKGIPVPDEFRFAKLKWRIDKLATDAWQSQESLTTEFFLSPSSLPATRPDKIIEAILNHVRLVAPGLSVPLRVPRVETGALIEAGGQFNTSEGWVVVKLATHLLTDRRAVTAILAHELCHYILENSGIRESDVSENERLTDVCMFVCGLGLLFIEGYKRDVAYGEYRTGHRLGYLSDAEYNFLNRYVRELRSSNSLRLLTTDERLERRLVARISDKQVRKRLIEHAKAKHPEKNDREIYEVVIASYERDHC
jgi:hypothetical protein